ncbi:MAG TPA: hypothetical protein VFR36_05130 [Sphingomicrobium sp.]|nr:hypothetical protein [Sphingomicrobium sp.]
MTTHHLIAILVFAGVGLLLIFLLDRLLRLRGTKDQSEGNYDHWSDGQVRIGDGNGDGGDGD